MTCPCMGKGIAGLWKRGKIAGTTLQGRSNQAVCSTSAQAADGATEKCNSLSRDGRRRWSICGSSERRLKRRGTSQNRSGGQASGDPLAHSQSNLVLLLTTVTLAQACVSWSEMAQIHEIYFLFIFCFHASAI